MSTAPTCRNCQHSRWRLSARGKITQRTSGTCAAQPTLSRFAVHVGNAAPCLEVIAHAVPIWPTNPAAGCPGFTPKEPPPC